MESQGSLKAGSLFFSFLDIDQNCQQCTLPKRKLWKNITFVYFTEFNLNLYTGEQKSLAASNKFNYSILIRLNLICIQLNNFKKRFSYIKF